MKKKILLKQLKLLIKTNAKILDGNLHKNKFTEI